MPLISIVIPVKNGKYFLQKCVESVLRQTFSDYEIIVLTDVSTNDDGTIDYLESLNLPTVRIEKSSQSLGIRENWERIMFISKSKYLTILGYDDILYPNYLEEMVKLIDEYPDATLYQGHFDYIDKSGSTIRSSPNMDERVDGAMYLSRVLKAEYPIIATGFLMKSSDYEKVGGMPTTYPNLLYADFELWIRMSLLGYQAICSKKIFAFRIHQSTTSVSSTQTTLQGLERFVKFLTTLQSDPFLALIIKESGLNFLKFHCNGISYRLIRSTKRETNFRVKNIIDQFEKFARQLGFQTTRFEQVKSINVALIIDRFSASRLLYLLLKKVYPKPLVKTPI